MLTSFLALVCEFLKVDMGKLLLLLATVARVTMATAALAEGLESAQSALDFGTQLAATGNFASAADKLGEAIALAVREGNKLKKRPEALSIESNARMARARASKNLPGKGYVQSLQDLDLVFANTELLTSPELKGRSSLDIADRY
jgi:hypothetical protein